MRALRPLVMLFAVGLAATATASVGKEERPLPAPALYMSGQYFITFRSPKAATYCPLPKDWVGSDHGTTVFLERPRRCIGVGYPSNSRGFAPDGVARIDLFYRYWMDEDELPPPPCRSVGTMRFMGAQRRICEDRKHGFVFRTVSARYTADVGATASLTLVTRPARLTQDMATFRAMAATVRGCSVAEWKNRKQHVYGSGPRCPASAAWF